MTTNELKFLRVRTEKHPTTDTTLEYLEHHNAIAVLILDEKEEKVLLVNQYRPGKRGNLYEVPAGLIDANEEQKLLVKKEVKERFALKDFEINSIVDLLKRLKSEDRELFEKFKAIF